METPPPQNLLASAVHHAKELADVIQKIDGAALAVEANNSIRSMIASLLNASGADVNSVIAAAAILNTDPAAIALAQAEIAEGVTWN